MVWVREPGESITNGYQLITSLSFSEKEVLQKHLNVLSAFLKKPGQSPDQEVEDAIDYFGFELIGTFGQDAYDHFHDFVATHPGRASVQNPAVKPDFYDLLRDLNAVMRNLSHAIKSTNDPAKVTADVKAVRAYLDAFSEFVGVDPEIASNDLPEALPTGLQTRLKAVNWEKWSTQVRGWVETVIKIIGALNLPR